MIELLIALCIAGAFYGALYFALRPFAELAAVLVVRKACQRPNGRLMAFLKGVAR